jgi:hypothetical protein
MSHPSRPAAKSVAALIAGVIDPVVRKRGLARAELLAWWPDIVGAAYAAHVVPERIRWSRGGETSTLVVRCDPAMALQFSYELDRVRERLNSYFGYPAVGAIRIVQQRVGPGLKSPGSAPAVERDLAPETEARLAAFDEPLRRSLRALGKGILAGS